MFSSDQSCGARAFDCLTARTLGLVGAAVLVGCGQPGITGAPATANRLVIAVPVSTDNPESGIRLAARLLTHEGLTNLDRTGRPVGRLAERWSCPADGLACTFELRPNVFFHDGTPFDAQAAKAWLDKLIGDAATTPGLRDVQSIEITGPLTLRFRLRARSALLAEDLVVDVERSLGESTVGLGPYRIKSSSPSEFMLEAHSSYYRGAPTVDTIVLRSYPTLRAAWASMMRGEVDALYDVGPEATEFVRAESSVRLAPFLRPYVLLVAIKQARPELRDPRVRQALNLAIDRQAIVGHALRGRGEVATDPIWPRHWARPSEGVHFSYEPARAARLLGEAGYRRLQLTCLIPERFGVWERAALLVQQQLAEVNVDLRLQATDFNTFLKRLASGDYELAVTEMSHALGTSRAYRWWHSPIEFTQYNAFGYASAPVDAALDALRRAPDDESYRTAVEQFQRAIYDDPPAVFIAWREGARAISRRFVVPVETGRDVLQTIASWQPAARARDRVN